MPAICLIVDFLSCRPNDAPTPKLPDFFVYSFHRIRAVYRCFKRTQPANLFVLLHFLFLQFWLFRLYEIVYLLISINLANKIF
jgi:hypothetical protein